MYQYINGDLGTLDKLVIFFLTLNIVQKVNKKETLRKVLLNCRDKTVTITHVNKLN